MENNTMEYNSQKELLIYPEYGRHVQGLIRNCSNIEDLEKRQAYIEQIIRLIEQMNPDYRAVENARLKIWQNIFNILGNEVELNYPEEVDKSPETERYNKAHSLEYPARSNKYRHYGTNVQQLLDKAISMEDENMKESFISLIGSYMKMVHKTWNNEKFISDEVIKNDITKLTKGVIQFEEKDEPNFNVLNGSQGKSQSHHKKRGKTSGRRSSKGKRRKR